MANKFVSSQSPAAPAASNGDESGLPDIRVLKTDASAEPVVEQFHFGKLQKNGVQGYAATKAKFGPLAATDADRVAKSKKDGRFKINDLLRDPLSIEEEERRVVEEKVRERVAAVSEDSKREATAVGYEEGLIKGHEEAFKKFSRESKERLDKFDAFLLECENAKRDIFQANERVLIELMYRIAQMVLLTELKTDKEFIARLARELIERIGVRENITVLIHPDDIATIDMIRVGLEKAMGTLTNLNIEPSTQVARGGCAIETEWNAIDASLETQLNGIYDALIGKSGGSSISGDSADSDAK